MRTSAFARRHGLPLRTAATTLAVKTDAHRERGPLTDRPTKEPA